MNLKRLFVVFLAVTLFFGAFGAIVGGLFGVGLGGPVGGYVTGKTLDQDGQPVARDSSGGAVEVGLGRPGDRPTGTRGAAVGAGFGLLAGSILGVLAALVDQVLHALRGVADRSREKTA